MEQIGFGREYFRQLLTTLAEKTKDYPLECFEVVADEPSLAPEHVIRLYRLKQIVTVVKTMGIKKFYQMPEKIRAYHDQEEWVQDAMRILLEQAQQYDPQRLPSFNRFILSRVKQRLIDIQRALFRKNSLIDEERLESNEPIQKSLELPDEDTQALEDQIIQKEQWALLWGCIEQLELQHKLLFVLREFDEVSFQELFKKFADVLESKSQSTFQRRYHNMIFGAVKTCVQKRYNLT